MIYTFRFVSDEEDDFIIDININHNQSLEELHNTIQKTLNFEGNQLASFFTSNKEWEKLEEIPFVKMDETSKIEIMNELNIEDVCSEKEQNILYIFDFFNERLLFGKVIRTINAKSPIKLPSVSKLEGIIPKQIKEIPIDEDILSETDDFDNEFNDSCFNKDDFDNSDDFDYDSYY